MKFKILLLVLFLVPIVFAFSDAENIETEINIYYNGSGILFIEDETNDVWEKVFGYNDTFNKTLSIEFERGFECESDKMCKICEEVSKFQKDCTSIYEANTNVSSRLVACEEREKISTNYKTTSDTCISDKTNIENKLFTCESDLEKEKDKHKNNGMWIILAGVGGGSFIYYTKVHKPRPKERITESTARQESNIPI